MAHGLRLGQAGQANFAFALQPAEARLERRRRVEVDAGEILAPGLEDQRPPAFPGRDWK